MYFAKLTVVIGIALCGFTAFAGEFSGESTPTVSEVCAEPENSDGVAQLRAKYVCEIESYLPLVKASLADTDAPIEEQAKILNQLRREIGLKYKKLTPSWLRNMVYCRNQKVYNDPLGPTYDTLVAKGKKDEDIAASAIRTGGKDLLLDNKVAVTFIDFVNYMNLGASVEALWSWLPGEACPMVD